jgi:FkbM family methyltransferase
MLAVGTVCRAAHMRLLYANFVSAYRNRARPYADMQGNVEYRLRNGLRLAAAPGPHEVRITNEIWIDGEYGAVDSFLNRRGSGANKGYFTSWALMKVPTAHMHCYEPDPQNVRALRTNVAPFATYTSIHQAAVGSSTGSLTLFRLAGRGGQDSVYESRAQSRGQIVAEVSVPVVSLSDVVTLAGQVDLLTVDVEGAEYDILLDNPPEALDDVRRIALEADIIDPRLPDRRTSDLLGRLASLGSSEVARTRSVVFLAREPHDSNSYGTAILEGCHACVQDM